MPCDRFGRAPRGAAAAVCRHTVVQEQRAALKASSHQQEPLSRSLMVGKGLCDQNVSLLVKPFQVQKDMCTLLWETKSNFVCTHTHTHIHEKTWW